VYTGYINHKNFFEFSSQILISELEVLLLGVLFLVVAHVRNERKLGSKVMTPNGVGFLIRKLTKKLGLPAGNSGRIFVF